MIGRIAGKLLSKQPPQIVVDVQGVGYEIDVPMSTLYQLPAIGADITFARAALRRRGDRRGSRSGGCGPPRGTRPRGAATGSAWLICVARRRTSEPHGQPVRAAERDPDEVAIGVRRELNSIPQSIEEGVEADLGFEVGEPGPGAVVLAEAEGEMFGVRAVRVEAIGIREAGLVAVRGSDADDER